MKVNGRPGCLHGNHKVTALVLVTQVLVATHSSSSIAADENGAPTETGSLMEIVVTANKRSENMQDVPIAIDAVPAAQLAAAGITETSELGQVVPGLTMQASQNGVEAHLRGVGTSAIAAGEENSIATYIDGVYISSLSGAMLQLSNIQQVEVDKGPQGTLFGRNATGGVIDIHTKDPQQAVSGTLEASYGNYETATESLYLTGGITPTLAADVSAYISAQGEGWGRNEYNGEYVNRENEYAARTKWLWTPTEADTIRVSADFTRSQGNWLNAFAPYQGHPTQYGPGPQMAGTLPYLAPYVAAGAVSPAATVGTPFTFNGSFYDVDAYSQPRYEFDQSGGSMQWTHAFDAFRVESISAYRGAQKSQYWSAEPVPAFVESAGWNEHEWEGSEELHVASDSSSKISWLGGLYFLRSSAAYDPFVIDGTADFPLQRIQFLAAETTKSEAVFGQTTIPIVSATNLTIGLRYTRETRGLVGDTTLVFPAAFDMPNIVTGLTDAHATFSKLTWRLSLDHRFSDNVMVYVSDNRGFKSGVYNTVPPGGPTATPVQPEVLDAYEIGAKTDWLNHQLRFNASAFYYNYSDLQVTVFNTTSAIIENGAKAQIYGLDADVAADLTPNLTLHGGIEALKDKFVSYPQAQFLVPVPAAAGGGNNAVSASAAGNQLPYTPKFIGDIAADYVMPLQSGAKIAANVNFYYSTKWFAGPDNILAQGAYHLLNSRIAWTLPGDKLTFALWGKNLTNEQYYTFLSAGNNPGGYDEGIVAPPRTYGASVKYSF